MSRIADSLVEEGLLTPLRDSKTGEVKIGRVRGISQEGLRELDRLEHSWRTYFERHWAKWLLVGLAAITASATAITAAAQFFIDAK